MGGFHGAAREEHIIATLEGVGGGYFDRETYAREQGVCVDWIKTILTRMIGDGKIKRIGCCRYEVVKPEAPKAPVVREGAIPPPTKFQLQTGFAGRRPRRLYA